MLVERKGERLEVEDSSDTEEAIDPDTERMRGKLGVEARDAPVCVVIVGVFVFLRFPALRHSGRRAGGEAVIRGCH